MALREALNKLVDNQDLTSEEASASMAEIIDSDVSPALISAFLIALRMKGETPDEIAGLASTMRERAVPVNPKSTDLVDTCGTGGDGCGTVNISTAAAFVVAGAGLPVAKHGNRALSSKAGSADVLEALGVPLDLTAERVAECIDQAGIGFMFAPAFHPAMAKVMPLRRELGIRTTFNLLGPLINPARPSYQLVGVGDPKLAELVAGAFAQLQTKKVLVVHGAGGTDELTLAGDNLVLIVEDGNITKLTVSPDDTGLDPAPLMHLTGGTAQENATRIKALMDGEPGPIKDCVLLNAGAAFVAARTVSDLREGIDHARKSLESGDAGSALDRLISVSNLA